MKKILFLTALMLTNFLWSQSNITITGPGTVETGIPANFTFTFNPVYPFNSSGTVQADTYEITGWSITTGQHWVSGGSIPGTINGVNQEYYVTQGLTDNNNKTLAIQWSDGSSATVDEITAKVSIRFYKQSTGETIQYTYLQPQATKLVDIQRINAAPVISGPSPVVSCNRDTKVYSVSNVSQTNANKWLWSVTTSSGSVISDGIVGANDQTSVTVKPPQTGSFIVKCVASRSTGNPNYTKTGVKNVSRNIFQTTATISGSETVCSTAIFSLNNIPAGQTFDHWQVSNSNIASLSSTTTTTTALTKISRGSVVLTAWVRNVCNEFSTISRTIILGTPMASIAGYYCPTESAPCNLTNAAVNNYLHYTLTAEIGSYIPPSEDWQWEKISGNFYFNENGLYNSNTRAGKTADIFLTGANPTNNPLSFKVRVKNPCGWGDWRTYTWNDGTTTSTNPGGEPEKYFKVSPNPATYGFGISLLDPNVIPPGNNFPAGLYNPFTGALIKTGTVVNNACSFYTGDVASGTYYVKITIGSHIEYHTLIRQ